MSQSNFGPEATQAVIDAQAARLSWRLLLTIAKLFPLDLIKASAEMKRQLAKEKRGQEAAEAATLTEKKFLETLGKVTNPLHGGQIRHYVKCPYWRDI